MLCVLRGEFLQWTQDSNTLTELERRNVAEAVVRQVKWKNTQIRCVEFEKDGERHHWFEIVHHPNDCSREEIYQLMLSCSMRPSLEAGTGNLNADSRISPDFKQRQLPLRTFEHRVLRRVFDKVIGHADFVVVEKRGATQVQQHSNVQARSSALCLPSEKQL